MTNIDLTVDDVKTLRNRAYENGTIYNWSELALDWMYKANEEILRLRQELEKVKANATTELKNS